MPTNIRRRPSVDREECRSSPISSRYGAPGIFLCPAFSPRWHLGYGHLGLPPVDLGCYVAAGLRHLGCRRAVRWRSLISTGMAGTPALTVQGARSRVATEPRPRTAPSPRLTAGGDRGAGADPGVGFEAHGVGEEGEVGRVVVVGRAARRVGVLGEDDVGAEVDGRGVVKSRRRLRPPTESAQMRFKAAQTREARIEVGSRGRASHRSSAAGRRARSGRGAARVDRGRALRVRISQSRRRARSPVRRRQGGGMGRRPSAAECGGRRCSGGLSCGWSSR